MVSALEPLGMLKAKGSQPLNLWVFLSTGLVTSLRRGHSVSVKKRAKKEGQADKGSYIWTLEEKHASDVHVAMPVERTWRSF